MAGPGPLLLQDEPARSEPAAPAQPANEPPAEAKSPPAEAKSPPAEAKSPPAEGKAAEPQTSQPAEAKTNESSETPATEPKQQAATSSGSEMRTVAKLTFANNINAPTLRDKIKVAYNELHEGELAATVPGGKTTLLDVPGLLVDTDEAFDWDQESAVSSKTWFVNMIGSKQDVETVLTRVKHDLASSPVFPSSSKIGGKVAGDTRSLAIAALIASLFGIVGYIWIRFQHVVFGVAAVLALVHDVLITLGAIAISAYVAGFLGFLQVEEFKINLPIVAAFLTIIGYSLNDTIVVFDRIREVRGKSPDLTPEMINTSINQTLSRTLLTSFTTLIVVVILYAIGGQGIHGFAFSLLVGILVGTYSSIYIASPVLLWMFNRNRATT